MVNFDRKYLKVQIPHFSENFRLKQKFWIGGGGQGTPPPNCENVPYGKKGGCRFLTYVCGGCRFLTPVPQKVCYDPRWLKSGGFAPWDNCEQKRPSRPLSSQDNPCGGLGVPRGSNPPPACPLHSQPNSHQKPQNTRALAAGTSSRKSGQTQCFTTRNMTLGPMSRACLS